MRAARSARFLLLDEVRLRFAVEELLQQATIGPFGSSGSTAGVSALGARALTHWRRWALAFPFFFLF
jgi:hypothetical protein